VAEGEKCEAGAEFHVRYSVRLCSNGCEATFDQVVRSSWVWQFDVICQRVQFFGVILYIRKWENSSFWFLFSSKPSASTITKS
jgi:hypothetical protein